MRHRLLTVSAALTSLFFYGCAAETVETASTPVHEDELFAGAAPEADESQDSAALREPGKSSDDGKGAPPSTPTPDPGPPPTQQCTVQKDGEGFFVRSSAQSSYVAYVPASYVATSPMRLVVGLHGCGDTAANFARWGVNPFATRASQTHIGISIGGKDNACWTMGSDDAKVLAAVDDIAKCFWVDRSKVVVAGFSSGGQLAYRVGLLHAERFAGILIENSSLYAAGLATSSLLGGAAWKLPIAHRAHTGDSVFPIAKVRADWTLIDAATFPLETSEVSGGHDGTSEDWAQFLLPASASWVKPE